MLIQVSKIRKARFVSARRLSEDGSIIDSHKSLSIQFPSHVGDDIQTGSVWHVEGAITEKSFKFNGFTRYEDHLKASTAILEKPRTALIEHWLINNIDAVGRVKASRLARTPKLVDYIDEKNFEELRKLKLNDFTIHELLRKFPNNELLEVINWLSERKIPIKIANVLIDTWGTKTVTYLEENPFRLMSLGVSFKICCSVAEQFGFSINSPIYKAALCVNIIKEYCSRNSSTVMPKRAFQRICASRFIDPVDLLQHAAHQELVAVAGDGYQLEGEWLLESLTARSLRNAFFRKDGEGDDAASWEKAVTDSTIYEQISDYQSTIDFELTDDQKTAIHKAAKFKVFSISGGAGTGKTTILNGVLNVLEGLAGEIEIIQLALSGRAAQRMSEATKRPASTIAKFCADMKNVAPEKRDQHVVCVIDEASMVDLVSMHNALKYLPLATRFIFVGDTDQLPPVGSGLVFHALMRSDFPKHVLQQVKRQSDDSGIHQFATAVRHQHEQLTLDDYSESEDSDATLYKTSDPEEIIELAESFDPETTVILTATKNSNCGVRNLNKLWQAKVGLDRPCVQMRSIDGDQIDAYTSHGLKLFLGDPVMITKNAYDADVRNGDIGFIKSVETIGVDDNYGVIEIDGRNLNITEELLDKIEIGYTMTIHKSQGSQWSNVILVIDEKSQRMLDKTLLYTGATRPTEKLIVCAPNMELLQAATDRGSIALQRSTNIQAHLDQDI